MTEALAQALAELYNAIEEHHERSETFRVVCSPRLKAALRRVREETAS